MNSDINNLLNCKLNKLKPDLGLKQLALLGLIYSIWTQGILLKAFGADYYAEESFFLSAGKNIHNIAYVTTTLGILYENKNTQQICFQLWGFVKIVDLIFCLASVITSFYFQQILFICYFIYMLLGMYLTKLMKNVYDQKFSNEFEKNKKETIIDGS